jgi:hypothetical protein
MAEGSRRARAEDVQELVLRMPQVSVWPGRPDRPIYQVGGNSFVFYRNPRPDAVDPQTGERYADVIVFWVPSEAAKQALLQDEASPFFTTPHFDGHLSVLLRESQIGELTLAELTEAGQEAWLSRASPTRAAAWLRTHTTGAGGPPGERLNRSAQDRESADGHDGHHRDTLSPSAPGAAPLARRPR